MNSTNYLERMNLKDITDCPCANCLKDTEDMIRHRNFEGVCAGDRLWYETYAAETDEFVRVLKQYTPSTLLDVGTGYGRVISLITSTLPAAKITGTEIDKATHSLAQQRFAGNHSVSVELCDVVKYLTSSSVEPVANRPVSAMRSFSFMQGLPPNSSEALRLGGHERDRFYRALTSTDTHFDMATCLMNTYGNINDESLFMEIMRHVNYFVFSLYNPLYDKDRAVMYEARCHLNFSFDGKQYHFTDPWTNVKVSRSYSKDEIEMLVKKANSDIIEIKEVGILHFCVAKSS